MQYLRIRNSVRQVRADGSAYAVPLHVTKSRKYGKVISEKAISRKSPVLVTGAHDSGKTRWLMRLHEHAAGIWGAKHKAEPLWLGALRPLAAWCDAPFVEAWWEQIRKAEVEAGAEDARKPWTKLKQWERAEVLPDYCRDTGAILFIDDAHKLSGRKLQIARLCALSARLYVVAASEEQRIPPNLRTVLMRRDPQIFRLETEAAYDATNLVMWVVIVACLGAGFWEASLVLGGLKALGSGRRASRSD